MKRNSQKAGILLTGLVILNLTAYATQDAAQMALTHLEASTQGRLGVAALNLSNGQRIEYRAHEFFPMGCTSKVMGVAAILNKAEQDKSFLQKRITYTEKDLTNWTPITKLHVTDGMTIRELSAAAISYSDNTAMNLLANELGGVQGINHFARLIHDRSFQLDHGWPKEAFAKPYSKQDASTPSAMRNSLQNIVFGKVLAEPERLLLIDWLKKNTTGDNRIRAGTPKDWVVGDKTGTGFYYGTTNDIAVIWPPNCAPIIVTLFYSGNSKDTPKRDDILASATKIIIHAFGEKDTCLRQG